MIYAWHHIVVAVLAWAGAEALTRSRWLPRSPRAGLLVWQGVAAALTVSAVGVLIAVGLAPYHRGLVAATLAFAGDLGRLEPAQVATAVAGLGLLAWIAGATLVCAVDAVRRRRRQRVLLSLVGRSDHAARGATVVDHPLPAAYCLPGRARTVVVSTGTLRHLDPAQLAAVLAHERAHLVERHDLVLLPFAALQRAFPRSRLARRVLDQVGLLVELRADERAAREQPATDLAAALDRFKTVAALPTPDGALPVSGSDIELRVARLRAPSPDRQALRIALLALAASLVGTSLSLVVLPL